MDAIAIGLGACPVAGKQCRPQDVVQGTFRSVINAYNPSLVWSQAQAVCVFTAP